TLFDSNKEIDFSANEKLIDRLIDAKINGILLLGSTGEFPYMDTNEKSSFIERGLKYINKRVPTIVGVSSTILEETYRLIEVAEKNMADALIVIAPYYYTMDERGLYSYFSDIARKTALPIIIYNFPERNNINISPNLIYALALEHKNIIGIKDTVDNISHTRKIILQFKNFNRDFYIFSGLDEYLIPNIIWGGSGGICGLSNIAPKLYVEIVNAFKNKDIDRLVYLQGHLSILLEIFDISNPFTIAIKYALNYVDSTFKHFVKYPNITLDNKKVEQIEKIISNIKEFV
ncbi:MAG: dihydrodipicolinate synthase family protein, partial [Deferribacterota bacterium]|nr:dihydrodipicolinate synthase family protein [Deferribacterota bacterium]